jgi:NitT/TauT family transport system substrate-binding protein
LRLKSAGCRLTAIVSGEGRRIVKQAAGRRQVMAVAAIALGLGMRRAAAAAPVTVRFGSVGGMTDAGLLLADDLGFLSKSGIALHMSRLPSAPALLTALALEQIDVAGISVTPGLFSSIGQGVQLRIVGDKQSVRPGFSATRLVVRSGLPVASEADTARGLKGKTIAVSSKAAGVYMVVLRYLAGYGLGPGDVHVVELSYPSMVPALASGAVDAAAILEPFLTESLQGGMARPLNDLVAASGATATESSTSVPLVYGETFARTRGAAQDFMDAYIRGVRVYNDAFTKGIDKDKVIEIISRRARLDPKIVRDAFPAGLDPNGHVSMGFLQACQMFFVQQHDLQAPIDLTMVVDPSFAQSSVARLGVYA